MQVVLNLPDIDIKIDELKLLLAVKLLEEGIISLDKASEIVGYNERTFSEILLKSGISPIKYESLDPGEQLENV